MGTPSKMTTEEREARREQKWAEEEARRAREQADREREERTQLLAQMHNDVTQELARAWFPTWGENRKVMLDGFLKTRKLLNRLIRRLNEVIEEEAGEERSGGEVELK
ncbi:MAG: hypothetical protein ACM3RP_00030 [Chitinophagales bacterium]